MNLDKLNDWLQLIASIGVIIGLLLVVAELRQDAVISRVEMNAAPWNADQGLNQSLQNETTSRALEKSVDAPLEMTTQDHIIVNAFNWEVINAVVARENSLTRIGLADDSLEINAQIAAEIILASDYGRAWWEENKIAIPESVKSAMERAAVEPIDQFRDRSDRIENRLREHYRN